MSTLGVMLCGFCCLGVRSVGIDVGRCALAPLLPLPLRRLGEMVVLGASNPCHILHAVSL